MSTDEKVTEKKKGKFKKIILVIVVAAFGKILRTSVLQMTPYGCLNVHASLLPKYRGAAPVQWAILDGEEKTGVTIMRTDAV